MSLPVLFLKKREDRRIKAGHVWVFSNEVDTKRSPLKGIEPGSLAEVQASNGQTLGVGYVNPKSLISVRLLSRDTAVAFDRAWLQQQILSAWAWRNQVYAEPFYRLVFGESDGLPGLVIDRYDDTFVVQITTAGMERVRDDIVSILVEEFSPMGILLRNDTSMRALEGLPSYVEVAHGDVAETVQVKEGGLSFQARPQQGQKTGWFYDQRDNRERLLRYVKGRSVLDLFSYIGAWGLRAAQAGAKRVTCVDSSMMALMDATASAEDNDLSIHTVKSDVFDALKQFKEQGEAFGVIVADPPAFIKRRKDQKEGQKAYQRLYQMAIEVLEPNGVLVAASCSSHFSHDDLRQSIRRASSYANRSAQILEFGGQGPDHPVHPAIPETQYLKAYYVRVL